MFIKLLRLGQGVIYVAQKNRVAATCGKFCVVSGSLHDNDVVELAFCNFRSELLQFFAVNFGGIDPARRPNFLRSHEAVLSIARTDVRHNCPCLPMCQLCQTSDLLAFLASVYSESYVSPRPEQDECSGRDGPARVFAIHGCSLRCPGPSCALILQRSGIGLGSDLAQAEVCFFIGGRSSKLRIRRWR